MIKIRLAAPRYQPKKKTLRECFNRKDITSFGIKLACTALGVAVGADMAAESVAHLGDGYLTTKLTMLGGAYFGFIGNMIGRVADRSIVYEEAEERESVYDREESSCAMPAFAMAY